ncbi:MAG TPA: tetraacyldisaccharide 4'-kinase, partial [Candidatus Eisenbacteria bacterium]|nr:tetraacyldisaccharide 4'-kinase [Candidatus Eisenbacteria bacterium]
MNERWIQRVWRGEGFFARLGRLPLIPFSLGYWALSQTRNALYALGCLRRCRLDIPVISIGNLTVGGTGKTPACLWLAAELE